MKINFDYYRDCKIIFLHDQIEKLKDAKNCDDFMRMISKTVYELNTAHTDAEKFKAFSELFPRFSHNIDVEKGDSEDNWAKPKTFKGFYDFSLGDIVYFRPYALSDQACYINGNLIQPVERTRCPLSDPLSTPDSCVWILRFSEGSVKLERIANDPDEAENQYLVTGVVACPNS